MKRAALTGLPPPWWRGAWRTCRRGMRRRRMRGRMWWRRMVRTRSALTPCHMPAHTHTCTHAPHPITHMHAHMHTHMHACPTPCHPHACAHTHTRTRTCTRTLAPHPGCQTLLVFMLPGFVEFGTSVAKVAKLQARKDRKPAAPSTAGGDTPFLLADIVPRWVGGRAGMAKSPLVLC